MSPHTGQHTCPPSRNQVLMIALLVLLMLAACAWAILSSQAC